MNPTLYLCCLGVIIGSLVWPAIGQQDFESARTHIINVFGNPRVSMAKKEEAVPFLAEFLWTYGNQIDMTPDQQYHFNEIFITNCQQVEQGSRMTPPKYNTINLGIELARGGIRKKQDKLTDK